MRSKNPAFILMMEDGIVRGLRSGQSHWIAAVRTFRTLNFCEIDYSDVDCFNSDKNIPAFLDWLDKQP